MRKRKKGKKKKRKCGSAQPTRSIRCPAEHEWLVGWHGHRHSRDTAGTKGVEEDHDKTNPVPLSRSPSREQPHPSRSPPSGQHWPPWRSIGPTPFL